MSIDSKNTETKQCAIPSVSNSFSYDEFILKLKNLGFEVKIN